MSKHLISRRAPLRWILLAVWGVATGSLAAQTGPAEAPVRPGDVVRVRVLRDTLVSGQYVVNQYGGVVLPLLGEYDASKETDRTLRAHVIRALQDLREGSDIEVTVLRRVRVIGEVNEPGVFTLEPTMTIADAVALAKGRTRDAHEGMVLVQRGGALIAGDLRKDRQLAESPVQSGDEIRVPRMSWAARNTPSILGGALGVAGLLVSFLR